VDTGSAAASALDTKFVSFAFEPRRSVAGYTNVPTLARDSGLGAFADDSEPVPFRPNTVERDYEEPPVADV
jgi:hypothetical protein